MLSVFINIVFISIKYSTGSLKRSMTGNKEFAIYYALTLFVDISLFCVAFKISLSSYLLKTALQRMVNTDIVNQINNLLLYSISV